MSFEEIALTDSRSVVALLNNVRNHLDEQASDPGHADQHRRNAQHDLEIARIKLTHQA